ncbi:MAG: hypothetical protein H5T93_08045 [Pseudothermotoga sp.]|uniref:hypothetical protein n=1 Tax=Pseudothermotoga sp. TaxID=2033661 RepID=UPI000A980139|nr:hypothetical protein [Pseudothermotoga sp.]MDK2922995.1 hypothetical protein [Pseudothermotoga sp.]HBT39934.1 hypothetical protein [Pseudothermotoga sp.]HCO97417.1 hypothetical protein [Pseudothermotoga sp.]
MSYLKKRLELYKRTQKRIKSLKEAPEITSFGPGDVVCIWGDTGPIYALVIEDGVVKNCILLSPELFLAGDGLLLRVKHLVNLLRVTPINFYLTPSAQRACERIGKLKQEELTKVVENHQKLRERSWTGVRKEFFEYETRRIEILYEMFLKFLSQTEQSAPQTISLKWDELRHLFGEKDLELIFPKVPVAQSPGVDLGRFLIVRTQSGIRIIFADELISRTGKVTLAGKTIYSGQIPQELFINFENPPAVETLRNILNVDVEEETE